MHSQKTGIGTSGWFLSGSSYITAPGIGIFFMLSGALILGKARYLMISDEELDTSGFLKHRLSKILIPLFFWYLVYWSVSSIDGSGLGVLWFLWTLAGLYLLSPILIRWMQHAKPIELLFYLCIWLVSLLYPLGKLIFNLNESDTSWIYYFHGYIGYYVLGYFLSSLDVNQIMKYKRSFLFFFSLFSIVLPIVVLFGGYKVDFYSLFWYLSLPGAMQCIMWFVLVRWFCERYSDCVEQWSHIIYFASSLTFGIYLMQILIMRVCLWNWPLINTMSSITHMSVCTILTVLIAGLFTYLIKKIAYLKYIIGG